MWVFAPSICLDARSYVPRYRANGVVPARVDEKPKQSWVWANTAPGALDQVRAMIFRKYVLKEKFDLKKMVKREGTVRHQPIPKKPKDPNAPQRKIIRKGAKKGAEVDEAAEKILLQKEREKRNEARFEEALQKAKNDHQKIEQAPHGCPFFQPRPGTEIADPDREKTADPNKMRYRFIKDVHWDPWKGCSIHGATSLGEGMFGKIFLAWRLPASYDPDDRELANSKVEDRIVAVKISKDYSKKPGDLEKQKVKREATTVLSISRRINGEDDADAVPDAQLNDIRKQKRAELRETVPHSANWTSKQMMNELMHLVPRPDSYYLVGLFGNEMFWDINGVYNVQIYKRCDMDLLGAMKKYTGVICDHSNSRGWKKHIADGSAKVNIFGSRGMKRDSGGTLQGFHPFPSWKADLGEIYNDVYQTDAETDGATQGLPVHIASRYFQQVLRALRYLKKLGFVHTDIKPENIFWSLGKEDAQIRDPPKILSNNSSSSSGGGAAGRVKHSDEKWDKLYRDRVVRRHEFAELEIEHVDTVYWNATLKIGDLGELLTEEDCKIPRSRTNISPPWYRSPEVLLADWPLTPALDMWSLAVTAWMMFTGKGVPFRPYSGGPNNFNKGGPTSIGSVNFGRTILEGMVKVLGPVPPHVVERADRAWKSAFPLKPDTPEWRAAPKNVITGRPRHTTYDLVLRGGNSLSCIGPVSDRFQTGFRPVSDQFQTSAMSDAQSMSQCHVGCTVHVTVSCQMHSHVGCTGALTEIHDSGPKVVQCWYGSGPLMFSLCVPSSGTANKHGARASFVFAAPRRRGSAATRFP